MIRLNNLISPSFYCHKLTIRFYLEDDIRMDAWPGAVFRNNFLYAAESILDDHGKSLRQKMDCIPLQGNHPYYKQLSGGFPKGVVFDCSALPDTGGKLLLEKNHIYTIYLIIIGTYIDYYFQLIDALFNMFARGFGYPMTASTVLDISEATYDSQCAILYSEGCNYLNKVSHPIRLSDYYERLDSSDKKATLSFHFLTPVSLTHSHSKVNGEISYQDKLNAFPSFYQFMRSVIYRLMTLNMLYGNEQTVVDKQTAEAEISAFLEAATDAFLVKANIYLKRLSGTPKKGQASVYIMSGYKGMLTWGNVDPTFIPLLRFASYLGVGNDINYGLGTFTCQLTKNEIK